MDDKTFAGSLAETKVMMRLTEFKYHVFNQISGKAPFDLVAYKDGMLYRISVKSNGGYGNKSSYYVQLRRIRSNKTKNVIHMYDNSSCDYVAVYLSEVDKVCFFKSDDIKSKNILNIRKDEIDNYLTI